MFHAIIQARMGSSRLPGKVLKKYKNICSLELIVKKLKNISQVKKIVIATTTKNEDKIFTEFCKINQIDIFRGSENDVLKRYYFCAKKFKAKNIIRITSDCPLIDIYTLRRMINLQIKNSYDYLANTYPLPCRFPDGSDIEIFKFRTLAYTFKKAFLPSDKEHVTKYMSNYEKFNKKKINLKDDFSNYRYTIDTKNDFILFCKIIDHFGWKKLLNLKIKDLINFIDKNKKLIKYQKNIKRNFGWKSSLEKDKIYLNETKS